MGARETDPRDLWRLDQRADGEHSAKGAALATESRAQSA